jgi:DNA primase
LSRIPRHIVDSVRERTDIVAVIGRHVRLQRKGQSYVGLCPFHQEKSGSFNVVPHKQMYYCFGCQAGGDVFRFLMQVEGLSFVEAVKELAGPAGIEVPEEELSAEEIRAIRQKATLYDVLEEAAGFYESVLWTRPEGAPGREYLKKRGLSDAMARKARVGFAPSGWTTLMEHLQRKGFDPKLALEVGLARPSKTETGSPYDTFRERVLFPIRDERNRVIAFGGRILQGDGPKYINTPETRLYQKSHVLYGLEMARQAISQKDRVLVVEGYFDVVSLHEAGFTEAVATCGTALTEHHLKKFRAFTQNVVVLLDSDEAGSRAAERILPMFLAAELQAWRLQLPGAKDPDELVRTEGPEAMERALSRKEPLVEWYIDRKLESRGSNAMGWQRTVQELLPLLHHLPDGVVSRIAARLGQPDEVLRQQVRAWRAPQPGEEDAPEPREPGRPVAPAWRPTRETVHLLWLLVHRYEQVADVMNRLPPDVLDPPVRDVFARLLSGEPVAGLVPDVPDPEVRRTLQAVVARATLYEKEQAALAACEIAAKLTAPWLESRLERAKRVQTETLRDGDMSAYRAAAEERVRLDSMKQATDAAIRRSDLVSFLDVMDQITALTSSPASS